MLGHPYRLTGRVVEGAGRGRDLGLPTANLADIRTLLPADGVYAGSVPLVGQNYRAAVHVGPNPTFGEQARKFEVHLLEFASDLYESTLSVDLIDRIRGTMKFSSAAALQSQIVTDLQAVRRLVSLEPSGHRQTP